MQIFGIKDVLIFNDGSMAEFFLIGGILYLICLIIFRKFFKVSSYYAMLVLGALIGLVIIVRLQLEEINQHAAHGAPLFMVLFAGYILALLGSLVFVAIDVIIWFVKRRKREKV